MIGHEEPVAFCPGGVSVVVSSQTCSVCTTLEIYCVRYHTLRDKEDHQSGCLNKSPSAVVSEAK